MSYMQRILESQTLQNMAFKGLLDEYDDFDLDSKPVKSRHQTGCCPISLSTICCLPNSDSVPQIIEMQSSHGSKPKSNSKTRDNKKNKKAARYRKKSF